jgi:hypothetical protein
LKQTGENRSNLSHSSFCACEAYESEGDNNPELRRILETERGA